MDLFEAVKAIPIRDLLEHYKYEIVSGKISCPWHQESNPSCHLNEDNSLYCFGACRKRRTAVDLAMLEEKTLNPLEAAEQLARIFNIAYIPMDSEKRREYLELQQEREAIWDVLTVAAEVYHAQLTPAHYKLLSQKWGLGKELVDKYLFGYAPSGSFIEGVLLERGFSSELIYSSGLLRKDKYDHFQDRLIFPYWKQAKVVYMIGRTLRDTPGKEGPAKYMKLMVYGDKNPHVSRCVLNEYFAGEDTVRGAQELLITEGITDFYAALQAGFACISPVTVRFREEDYPKLIDLTRGLKAVYLCFDTEDNGVGGEAALDLAEELEAAGVQVKIIRLPEGIRQ